MGWENLDGDGALQEHIMDYLGTRDRLTMRRTDSISRHDSQGSISARMSPIVARLGTRALQMNAEVAAYDLVTGPVIAVQNHPSRLTYLTVADALDTSLVNLENERLQASLLLQTLLGPAVLTPSLQGLRIQLQGISNGVGVQRTAVQARRAAVAAAVAAPAENDPMLLL